ncbi:hypothetical protein [Moraxella oblonga]|nr:hypothetical protein [Moraxella oblonga]
MSTFTILTTVITAYQSIASILNQATHKINRHSSKKPQTFANLWFLLAFV